MEVPLIKVYEYYGPHLNAPFACVTFSVIGICTQCRSPVSNAAWHGAMEPLLAAIDTAFRVGDSRHDSGGIFHISGTAYWTPHEVLMSKFTIQNEHVPIIQINLGRPEPETIGEIIGRQLKWDWKGPCCDTALHRLLDKQA